MRIFITIGLVLAFTVSAALAGEVKQIIPFANASTVTSGVKTSAVINASKFKTKTLVVNGMTRAGVFKTMSGTVIAQAVRQPPEQGGAR